MWLASARGLAAAAAGAVAAGCPLPLPLQRRPRECGGDRSNRGWRGCVRSLASSGGSSLASLRLVLSRGYWFAYRTDLLGGPCPIHGGPHPKHARNGPGSHHQMIASHHYTAHAPRCLAIPLGLQSRPLQFGWSRRQRRHFTAGATAPRSDRDASSAACSRSAARRAAGWSSPSCARKIAAP